MKGRRPAELQGLDEPPVRPFPLGSAPPSPPPTLPRCSAAPAPRGVRWSASSSLGPTGARGGPGVRRCLLRRPAPALPCFLLNNIAREAAAERARHNFLPDWGWAAVARDNPRCPCFLSPLAQPSTPGMESPPSPLWIQGHTWLPPGKRRQQSLGVGTRGQEPPHLPYPTFWADSSPYPPPTP